MRRNLQILATALLLMVTATAPAQSNSLFGRRTGATPSRNPARPARNAPPAGTDGSSGLDEEQKSEDQPSAKLVADPRPVEPRAAAPAAAGPAIRLPYMPARKPLSGQPLNSTLFAISTIAVLAPEPEKIRPGDTVTIIIREIKTSTTDAKSDLKKDWTHNWDLTKWFRLDPKNRLVPQNFERAGPPGADFTMENDWKGEGKVDRRDELTTRIQATVIDVKPNGNLVLEAKKKIGTDEEQQVVTLTGTCRSKDVTADNTVLSTQVADLNIDCKHTGAARDAARRGWLMRAFDWLRPF